MGNFEYVEYRVEPDKMSPAIERVFDIVFSVVDQKDVPNSIKMKGLLPEYILRSNLNAGRKKFIKSFYFPISKVKWQSVYNLKSLGYARNFYYGYKTEYHDNFEKFYKHHIFFPWVELTEETKKSMQEEFFLIIESIKRNSNIGKLFVSVILLLVSLAGFVVSPILGLICMITLAFALVRYSLSKKKIENSSFDLCSSIHNAYLSQDAPLSEKFMPYSQVRYGDLENVWI